MLNRRSRRADASCVNKRVAVVLLATLGLAISTVGGPMLGMKARSTAANQRATKRPVPLDPSLAPSLAQSTAPSTGPASTVPLALALTSPLAPTKVERTVAAVGDLVCPPEQPQTLISCRHQSVSDLLVADESLQNVLLLGDLQYQNGELVGFRNGYEKSYGRLNSMAIPTPGNHDYNTKGAAGYFEYFGARAHLETNGYYSVDLSPSWHLVVLNSNCDAIGGCGPNSPQHRWLVANLAANKKPCLAAIWHHPLFTSSPRGSNKFVRPLWEALDAAKADVILNGHEHNYERFALQDANGTAAVDGIRQFVVGTGGINSYPTAAKAANSEQRGWGFGYLRLSLHSGSYRWGFVGDSTTNFTDVGSEACRQK